MGPRLPLEDFLRFSQAFRQGHTPEEIAAAMQQTVIQQVEQLFSTLESQQQAAERLAEGWTTELATLSSITPQQKQLEELGQVVGDLQSYSKQLKDFLDLARKTLQEQSKLIHQAQQSLEVALSTLESSPGQHPQAASVSHLGARTCRFIARNRAS